jgi:VNT family MFS transporter (synaptic vesicle glycoprotein 2)
MFIINVHLIFFYYYRLGGSGPVIWSYFAEFQPKKKRGSMLSFMAAFWTLGNLFVAGMYCTTFKKLHLYFNIFIFLGLAWLVIPSNIGLYSPGFVYNSWRIYLLICSVPSFAVALLLFCLPESPKFLLSRGEEEKAMVVFKHIYSLNTGKDKDTFPVSIHITFF